MQRLGLPAADVTTQVYPRKLDWLVLNALAGIAASASTLAYNVRLMQSPPFGEWAEEFAAGQVGSTAMPWKRNPISAENVNSLARFVAALPGVAWQNEAANLLERTLDDSANRRLILPDAFLAVDEILLRVRRLAADLQVDRGAVAANVARYGPFAAVESVMLAATSAGGDRQALHERLREHAMEAWRALEQGAPNDLAQRVASDADVTRWLPAQQVRELFECPPGHLGDAAERARAMAKRARQAAA
jgi:adenylosuccinate lyase